MSAGAEDYDILDAAYESLEELDREENLSQTALVPESGFIDDRDIDEVHLNFSDENNLQKHIGVQLLEDGSVAVEYAVWKDYQIPGQEALRVQIEEMSPDPFLVLDSESDSDDYVRRAYETIQEIDEDDLKEEGSQSRLNSIRFSD